MLVELKRGEEIKAKLYTSKKSGKIHAKYQPTSVCCFKIQEDVSIHNDIWKKLSTRQKNKLRKICIKELPLTDTHYLEKNSVGTYGFKEHFQNTPEIIREYIENYLVNITFFKFTSTLTRLFNTNAYPVALVRPT